MNKQYSDYEFFLRSLSLAELSNSAGWDGEDAAAVSKLTWANVFAIYSQLPKSLYGPSIYPGTDGKIQLEWRNSKAIFEVSIGEDNTLSCYFNDLLEIKQLNKDMVLIDFTLPEDFLICIDYFI